MLIKVKRPSDVAASEITPEAVYRSRRDFLRQAALGASAAVAAACWGRKAQPEATKAAAAGLAHVTPSAKYALDTKIDPRVNTWDEITTYNNFYEFGVDKDDPARYAGQLTTRPWTVKVDGLCAKPAEYHIEDLLDGEPIEERIYRHRCVEGWSMVMPWDGFPLSRLLSRAAPLGTAGYVEFTSLLRPSEMPGQRGGGNLPYPYIEGLRMDEAMHPLTLVVLGLYGKALPNQDGAPLRIHVPWKYGFKSGKSIVRIRFTDAMPRNTWAVESPTEYGFYANVNPNVDHPRWSQKTERRLPGLLSNRPTLLFNGYADEVGQLYAGMDLTKNF